MFNQVGMGTIESVEQRHVDEIDTNAPTANLQINLIFHEFAIMFFILLSDFPLRWNEVFAMTSCFLKSLQTKPRVQCFQE